MHNQISLNGSSQKILPPPMSDKKRKDLATREVVQEVVSDKMQSGIQIITSDKIRRTDSTSGISSSPMQQKLPSIPEENEWIYFIEDEHIALTWRDAKICFLFSIKQLKKNLKEVQMSQSLFGKLETISQMEIKASPENPSFSHITFPMRIEEWGMLVKTTREECGSLKNRKEFAVIHSDITCLFQHLSDFEMKLKDLNNHLSQKNDNHSPTQENKDPLKRIESIEKTLFDLKSSLSSPSSHTKIATCEQLSPFPSFSNSNLQHPHAQLSDAFMNFPYSEKDLTLWLNSQKRNSKNTFLQNFGQKVADVFEITAHQTQEGQKYFLFKVKIPLVSFLKELECIVGALQKVPQYVAIKEAENGYRLLLGKIKSLVQRQSSSVTPISAQALPSSNQYFFRTEPSSFLPKTICKMHDSSESTPFQHYHFANESDYYAWNILKMQLLMMASEFNKAAIGRSIAQSLVQVGQPIYLSYISEQGEEIFDLKIEGSSRNLENAIKDAEEKLHALPPQSYRGIDNLAFFAKKFLLELLELTKKLPD